MLTLKDVKPGQTAVVQGVNVTGQARGTLKGSHFTCPLCTRGLPKFVSLSDSEGS